LNNHIRTGLIIILVFSFISVLYITFYNIDIDININERFENNSIRHFLGTDNLGRDIFSAVIFGFWYSLFIAFIVTLVASVPGVFFGILSGYFGGIIETLIMRIGDVILAFPGFLLVLIWISVIGNGFYNLVFAISFMSWVSYARLVRGEVLKLRENEYILAAKGYNASNLRIIIIHIFPHIIPVLLVQVSIELSNVILIESSLNFLGLGTGTNLPTLGQLVFYGQRFIFYKPSLIIIPGVVLFLLIISINLISEGLRLRKNKLI